MIPDPTPPARKHAELVDYICMRCCVAVNGGLSTRSARPDEPIAMSAREMADIICEALRLDRL